MTQQQKQRLLVTSAAVLTLMGSITAAGRYLLTPWFVAVASETLADEIDARIDDKTKPANNGIKAMLTANIEQLTDEVNLLKARQSRDPAKWTDLDVMMLSNAERRLYSAKAALAEFERDSAQAKARAR